MDRMTTEHPPHRRVQAAFPLYPCYVLLEFEQGEYRISDLSDYVNRTGELFEPLSKWEIFRQLRVEEDTLVFPNGLDFDPGILYEESKPLDVSRMVQ